MRAIKNFLSYVEISTKIASVIPFLVGTGYALYRYGSLKPRQIVVFFIAMLLFDMTTTALNNHVGHRQTGRTPHYSTAVSIGIILFMGLTATALGIYLVSISSVVILLVGMLCFGMGIIYNYGPLPISRTPFGEVFSGTVMGICIPFIAVEINHPMFNLAFPEFSRLVVSVNWAEVLYLGVITVPLICCIANIMLANNICDVSEDEAVGRYTLPFYIGVEKSLKLFRLLYIAAYVFIVAGCALRIIPFFTIAVLLTFVPVKKNIQRFFAVQDKGKTFFVAILNFLIILVPYAVCIWLGCVL